MESRADGEAEKKREWDDLHTERDGRENECLWKVYNVL
jgi:hypothetical protein